MQLKINVTVKYNQREDAMTIVDCSTKCDGKVHILQQHNVSVVGRYYSTAHPSRVLAKAEAEEISRAGAAHWWQRARFSSSSWLGQSRRRDDLRASYLSRFANSSIFVLRLSGRMSVQTSLM